MEGTDAAPGGARGGATGPEATGFKVIDRQIGLLGGTVLLIGTVIGISVFLLPGELIGQAGPSIVLALAITAVPMVLSVLSLLQLGGAMPVAGGLYVYGSRLVGPFWGFLSIWLVVPAIWSTLLFTSIGFAEFTRYFVDLPAGVLAGGVLALFVVLSLLGIRFVTWIQLAMVIAILLAILAFVLPGSLRVEAANYTPMFPEGVAPFLLAVVSLYIPFQGFAMIVELGEELKDPVRNIPRVLILGMSLAVGLSLALVAVFVGLAGADELADLGPGGVARAAAEFLPGWVGAAVAGGAVLGAFTTLNAVITSYSRTLMRAGRDEVVTMRLAKIATRTKVPHHSILVLSLPPLLILPFSPDVVTLTVFLALIILFGNVVGSVALWNLPKRYPERYEGSLYRLPMPLLRVAAIGSAAVAVLFWLAVLSTAPSLVVALLGLVALGAVYYRWRRRYQAQRGVDLAASLRRLHAHEEPEAVGGSAPPGRTAPAEPPRTPDSGSPTGRRRPPRKIAVGNPPPRRGTSTPAASPASTRDRDSRTRQPPRRGRISGNGSGGTTSNGSDGTTSNGSGGADDGDRSSSRAINRRDLASVRGLGPARIEALLEHFGSVDAVRDAAAEELMAVDGIGEQLAEGIWRQLR
jgi:basic amino acid/polyamine antiporter, APA family